MIYSHADCFGILFSQQIFDTEFLVVSGWFTAEDSSLDAFEIPVSIVWAVWMRVLSFPGRLLP